VGEAGRSPEGGPRPDDRVSSYRAAGGVVWRDGLVLVLDRPGRGEVRLPKGHVHHGESSVEAALRETREETGYDDLRVLAGLGTQRVEFELEGTSVQRDETYFALELGSDRIVERPPKDAAQFVPRWLPAPEAVALLSFESEKEWVRRATMWFASGAGR
jgi:8-oxo-dGTP pyrophosphatase MutT (NUDIX family)